MVSRSTSTVLDDLATSERTSTVDEPTVAANSKMVLVTGNWYATRSTDRGKTWTPVDPFAAFPMIGGNFCCDQLVLVLETPPSLAVDLAVRQRSRKRARTYCDWRSQRRARQVRGHRGTSRRPTSTRHGPDNGSTSLILERPMSRCGFRATSSTTPLRSTSGSTPW